MISEQIVYDAAIIKMNYPTYYEYLYPGSAIKLSDTYDSFLQNLEVDSKDNMMIPSYQNFYLYIWNSKLQQIQHIVNSAICQKI
ncbi:MAG: hypothetical protein IPP49_14935 [Saprospiraceae bacterium]|nr:hypothetical protein [Saprospiraceae bacterium]